MPVLVRIALRNLREHRAKTLIVGIIIALGIAVLVIGNSLMDTASAGLKVSFIDNYTGHIMIHGKAPGLLSLFGYQTQTGNEQVPVIPEYRRVVERVQAVPGLAGFTAQVTGFATVSLEDSHGESERSFTVLFGIEPASYRQMFDSVEIVAGRHLPAEGEGILLSEERAEALSESFGVEIRPGDQLLLSGFGNAGFRIREVPVEGIFRFRHGNEALDMISFVDVQTLRALGGMVVASPTDFNLTAEETSLLSMENTDDLFGGALFMDSDGDAAVATDEKLLSILGDPQDRSVAPSVDQGAWHYLLVRLENDDDAPSIIRDLNLWFDSRGISAQAVDWKVAAGGMAQTAEAIKVVFNAAILIVAVVAVIIIMNTLVISVIERTSEIGTMRALGAQKGFVWKMFMVETLAISVIFGIMGIFIGAAVIGVLGIVGIGANNAFLSILFGGESLHPVLSAGAVVSALVTVILIGFLSHLYPVWIALKVAPVRAIQTE